jgi:aldose 1-epimerase
MRQVVGAGQNPPGTWSGQERDRGDVDRGGDVRIAPSGRQVEIVHGDQRAVVVEVGGGLREFLVGDWPVLDGYDVSAQCTWGRGQLLLPWPNRIPDGQYELDGERQQLPLTEPDLHNAIHGLTRWSAWRLDQPARNRAEASHVVHPQPGYPCTLRCEALYLLDRDGLTVTMSVTNLSDRPAPVGMGAHPYFLVGDAGVDAASLGVPASTRLLTDDRGIPTGRADVAGTDEDFRRLRPIGPTALDTAYTDIVRDPDGVTRVRLAVPDRGEVTVWADQAWSFVQVFTGDTMPESERRRSVAVEPMTCAPNAFNSGEGLLLLAPDETVTGTWGIETSRG